MRLFSLHFLVTTLFLFASQRAAAEGNVLVLDADNAAAELASGIPTFVKFYAPWCGHCKSLTPVWEELADAFAGSKDKVRIAKLDADANRDIGTQFDIQGFPTLKYFHSGVEDKEDYTGSRELEDLADFITKKTGVRSKIKKVPSVVTVLDESNFDATLEDSSKCALVEFYAPWCGHCKALSPVYEKVAESFLREPHVIVAKMDATEYPNVANRFAITGYPTIKLFPAGGDRSLPENYAGGREAEDFVGYINEHCGTHRLLGGGLSSKAGLIERLHDLAYRFTHASEEAERKKAREEAEKEASSLGEHKYAKYYIKVMDKALASPEYVAKELARLTKIIATGTMAEERADDFTIRTNILRAFIPIGEREMDASLEGEEAKENEPKHEEL